MSNSSSMTAQILLKARPTPEQLADRTAVPVPAGMELYLDGQDISGDDWLTVLTGRIDALDVPDDFVWIVEGPLRSLDGSFFDVSQNSEANREVLRRVIEFGRILGAEASVIHVIALAEHASQFSTDTCAGKLADSLPLIRFYAELCHRAGLIPTVENIPPITKMREARLLHSYIGMEPGDLRSLVETIDGLQVTLDVSHAQLYLNAANLEKTDAPPEVAPVVDYLNRRREVSTLDEYIDQLNDVLFEAHISNAEGLFGEGLPYDYGDLDLDRTTRRLGGIARYLVTETIEADTNRAVLMREAQRRMDQVLATQLTTASRGEA